MKVSIEIRNFSVHGWARPGLTGGYSVLYPASSGLEVPADDAVPVPSPTRLGDSPVALYSGIAWRRGSCFVRTDCRERGMADKTIREISRKDVRKLIEDKNNGEGVG
jgi:hypothetical protein